MTLVDLGNGTVLQMPDFKHDLGDNDSLYAEDHVFKGSWRRHRGVEIPLIHLRRLIENAIGDAYDNLINILDVPIAIVLGLNCNFPLNDVAQFLIWRQKGCKPITVLRK